MLRDALFLIQHDLFFLLRRRETLLWTFVMPVIFFYFIGSISGGFGRANDPDPIAVAAPPDAGFLKDELIKRLEQRNFRVIPQQDFFRELRIPASFTASVLAGKPVKVEFIRHGANANSDYDQTRISRAPQPANAHLLLHLHLCRHRRIRRAVLVSRPRKPDPAPAPRRTA